MRNKDGRQVGFAKSPLFLNEDLGDLEHWTESEIQKRAKKLAALATQVWPYPQLSAEALAKYRKANGIIHTFDDIPYLEGTSRELFDLLRKRILNLDASVKEIIHKQYIEYIITTNFVTITPEKGCLQLVLTIGSDEIMDLKGLCMDFARSGRTENGYVKVILSSKEQFDDVMTLVKQSFEKQMENEGL
jgi:predicted transport protein